MVDRGLLFFLLSFFCAINAPAKERIAILSYGSLVKRPTHSITGARLCASKFIATPIMFPISLSLLENKDRITAVVDTKQGTPKRVWAAISDFNEMSLAMQNLAAREGSPYLEDEKQYDTQYIFYLKKITGDKIIEDYEREFDNWIVHDSPDLQQQLDSATIGLIIQWAQKNKCDVVLWVSCPIVPISQTDFIAQLIQDPILLKNAQMYVKLLPDGPQTEFEMAIIQGKQALTNVMHARK